MPDFRTKVKSWKCLWIKRVDINTTRDSVWMTIMNSMLPKIIPIQLLLKSQVSKQYVAALPNLSAFYKELLYIWSDTKDCVPVENHKDVLNQCLWANKFITIEGKCIIWKKWMEKGLFYINDLLNSHNSYRTPEQFYSDYGLKTNFLEILQIKQAIPWQWRQLMRNSNYTRENIITDIFIKIKKGAKLIKKTKTKEIYWLLLYTKPNVLERPACELKWEKELQIMFNSFDTIYKVPFTCCKYTKYQSFQYKIIHRIIACNYWLFKMKIHESGICSYCPEMDTVQHFFIHCPNTKILWKSLYNWWNSLDVPKVPEFYITNILFGYPENNKYANALNYILLLAKYHIYVQKLNNNQPFLPTMLTELKKQLLIDENISLKNGCHTLFKNNYDFVLNIL